MTASAEETASDGAERTPISRIIKAIAALVLLVMLLLIVAAFAAALTAAETWAPFVQLFRDVFLLLILLETLLLLTALVILLLQAASFFLLLRDEVKPILANARETTRLSKATAEFIHANATDPIIDIKSFVTGLLKLLRELLRLRAAMQVEESDSSTSAKGAQADDTHE